LGCFEVIFLHRHNGGEQAGVRVRFSFVRFWRSTLGCFNGSAAAVIASMIQEKTENEKEDEEAEEREAA